jgi:hypothetical protein
MHALADNTVGPDETDEALSDLAKGLITVIRCYIAVNDGIIHANRRYDT